MRWYVAHTQSRAEMKAAQHLRNQAFTVYMPRYVKRRSHARRIEFVAAPLFPRYIFVSMDLHDAPWRCIRSTVGVCDLVCHGDQPALVPEEVIEALRQRENKDGMVALPARNFVKGDRVHIVDGALCGLSGIFECATDEERVVILMDLLGRPVRVRLSPETIQPSA